MHKNVLSRFRSSLIEHRNSLLDWFGNSSVKTKKYRCDCIPEQGDLIAEQNIPIISEINKTIEQIDEGEFGKCSVCNDDVETERLECDYKINVCLDHYSDNELRDLERDLELASKVQKQLLPQIIPTLEGIEIAALSRPARIVGGDYYDFFCYRDCLQGLAIADVMGKGLPASMLMSNLQASLRILGPEHDELHIVVSRLNDLFRFNLKLIRFISIFLAAIDQEKNLIHYCNAGHHPPVLWNESAQSVTLLNPTGPALGLMPEAKYRSESITFNSGDILLLYTDGLVEARNKKGKEYGEDQLKLFLENHKNKSADYILNNLHKEIQKFAQKIDDDLTILVFKNKA
jgi:sigma-B regulation protein RsbU (phosphoserine phosphatase)